jgi:hypothetical protein
MKRKAVAVAGILLAGLVLTGCSSTRQIDPDATDSWQIKGTSWYGFCDGPNAFIWISSRNDSEPDELEAVIYDHYKCVGNVKAETPGQKTKPDTDPDGIVDNED